jgi:beta-lactamase regulating signal transducer with metallopeptidase domain
MSAFASVLHALSAEWVGHLLRACWQGSIAILVAWSVSRLLTRLSARFQCWLWRLAYLKLLVALLWAVPISVPLLPAARQSVNVADGTVPHAVRLRFSDAVVVETVLPVGTTALSQRAVPSAADWFFLVWLLGSCWTGTSLIAGWRRTQGLRREGELLRNQRLLVERRALCDRYRIGRQPGLLSSEEVGGPVLVGTLRPAIILPARFLAEMSHAQLQLILAHELAHLKRRDLAWAWLPSMMRVVLFFHPLLWLAEAQWRLAQEMACDELVLLSTGASTSHYGSMLLEVMGRLQSPIPAHVPAAGIAESFATVKRRLAAIRQVRSGSPPRRAAAAIALAPLAVIGLVPWHLTARAERLPTVVSHQLPAVMGRDRHRDMLMSAASPRLRRSAAIFRPGGSQASSPQQAARQSLPPAGQTGHLPALHTQLRASPPTRNAQLGPPPPTPASDTTDRRVPRAKARPTPIRLASLPPEAHRSQSDLTAQVIDDPPAEEIDRGDREPLRDAVNVDETSGGTPKSFIQPGEEAGTPLADFKKEEGASKLILMKKMGYLGLDGANFKRMAYEKGLAGEKPMVEATSLRMPKQVIVVPGRLGWQPSPLAWWARRSKDSMGGSDEPGALKKWLAQIHQQIGMEGKADPDKLAYLQAVERKLDQRLDDLKRQGALDKLSHDPPSVNGG